MLGRSGPRLQCTAGEPRGGSQSQEPLAKRPRTGCDTWGGAELKKTAAGAELRCMLFVCDKGIVYKDIYDNY